MKSYLMNTSRMLQEFGELDTKSRDGEMAQWIKSLATKPDDLSSVFRNNMGRDPTCASCLLTSTGMQWHTCTHTHTRTLRETDRDTERIRDREKQGQRERERQSENIQR